MLTRRGTPGRPDKDVVSLWRNEDGRWRRTTWDELRRAEARDDAARTREEKDLVLVLQALLREQSLPP